MTVRAPPPEPRTDCDGKLVFERLTTSRYPELWIDALLAPALNRNAIV